ncbi:MAG: sulfite exporter TauE/SafE family protein [Deinococcaceae bacterium]
MLSALALAIGCLAGVLGALFGLGGGVVVVPALEFLLPFVGKHIQLQQAVAISQVGVLAVGLSATSIYLSQRRVHVRLGVLLSPLALLGGILGSHLGLFLPAVYVAFVFAGLLVYSAYRMWKPSVAQRDSHRMSVSVWLFPFVAFAGLMSGLLGIGGGVVQVPALVMLGKLDFRDAVATSTWIMCITAVANIWIYQHGGFLDARLALTVALGILVGASLGAKLQARVSTPILRRLFSVLMLSVALSLLWKYSQIPILLSHAHAHLASRPSY